MFSLFDRLDTISRGWPPSIKGEFRRYIRRYCQESESAGRIIDDYRSLPYWHLFPVWLARKYNARTPGTIAGRVLDDILWGQYGVFLAMRIKDDLFDDREITSLLFFAADQFLADASAVFFRHLHHSNRFRDIFTGSINETVRAFMEVEAMLRRRRVSLRRLRDGHARVSSVFKIGSAAICHLAGRPRDFAPVSAAADNLAVAGQILDDFRDMNEDLDRGRLNYAARFIMGTSRPAAAGRDEAVGRIAERLLYSGRLARLFREVIRHVESARDVLGPLRLPKADRYFSDYVQAVRKMADEVARERSRRIFGISGATGVRSKPATRRK